MSHMTLFPGTREIVEIEELNPGEHYRSNGYTKPELKREEKDRRSLASNAGHISSVQDDLNQLFEIFNRRTSSHGLASPNEAGTPRKNASKKPVGGSHSPRHGISERVNLKQALRGLCLSQASEMAAVKRSTKSASSSQPGRIMTMFNNVVVGESTSDHSQEDGRGDMLEISLVPEQTTFDSFQNFPENSLASDLWPSNRSSLAERGGGATPTQSERILELKLQPEKDVGDNSPENEMGHSILTHNGMIMRSAEVGNRASVLMPTSSSPTSKNSTREIAKSSTTEDGKSSVSSKFASRTSLGESLQKDKHASLHSSSLPNDGKTSLELTTKSVKVEANDLGLKIAEKDSSEMIPSTSSPKGKKVSKSTRNARRLVKPLIKTKNFVKRKSKKNKTSDNSSKKNTCNEFNNDLYSSPNPIVCPRCQCVVTDVLKEANQESPDSNQESLGSHQESPVSYVESPVSPFASLSTEISSSNVISDVSTPGPSSDSLNKSMTVNKGEFTRISKGSPGECSSSISVSEGSNPSRPSFCDRPHMSKDVRWQAIRNVRFEHGSVGLRHFNLLKKLGCGDIGTVYLAELIGSNCFFAIKVMDNEFLARRKKITRAQTEKEILRILDHPFLPTLYCQFTSDNLSCLVMEYCPGGDLHVLRQRQPGRCFTEQAARFYVAEVLLALEYLHMLGVVYRDLKPENILVREDGHIMLSDFDLSLRCVVSPTLLVSSSMSEPSRHKRSGPCIDSRCVQPLCIEPSCQVTCFTPRRLATSSKSSKLKPDLASEMRPLLQLVAEPTTARSNSFVGTHEYLAPEIIKGEGHGSAVDWWTFGIFLYELLYGRTPFKGAGNEETLANVILQSLKFPDGPLVSLQARDLIAALLVKEPENRLGTERGAAEIKQHSFFDGLNWALIRCAVPPELPENPSYRMEKAASHNNNTYVEYSSGSGEHLEFEEF